MPNLTSLLDGILSGNLENRLKLPIDLDGRLFYILCLYSAAFLGLDVLETKKYLTSQSAQFIENGETEVCSLQGPFQECKNNR